MAIGADCEHLSAQIEEYILCTDLALGFLGGSRASQAQLPLVAIAFGQAVRWAHPS